MFIFCLQDLVVMWEDHVVDHAQFRDAYSDAVEWLSQAKSQYQVYCKTSGTRDTTDEHRQALQVCLY